MRWDCEIEVRLLIRVGQLKCRPEMPFTSSLSTAHYQRVQALGQLGKVQALEAVC